MVRLFRCPGEEKTAPLLPGTAVFFHQSYAVRRKSSELGAYGSVSGFVQGCRNGLVSWGQDLACGRQGGGVSALTGTVLMAWQDERNGGMLVNRDDCFGDHGVGLLCLEGDVKSKLAAARGCSQKEVPGCKSRGARRVVAPKGAQKAVDAGGEPVWTVHLGSDDGRTPD